MGVEKRQLDGLYDESSKDLVLIRDVKLEGGRQRHPSGGVSAKEMVIGLEGVELGADGKVRNLTSMLCGESII